MTIDLGRHCVQQATRTCLTWSSALVLAAASVACGAGNDDADPTETPLATEDQPARGLVSDRLHELDLGDQRLTFDWVLSDMADDGTPLDVEGAAAGYFSISYVSNGPDLFDALMAENGMLTSLEIFTAFAPHGLEPDPMLVEAHEGEARALGRTDLAPKVLDAAEIAIDKAVPANCDSTLYPNPAPLTWVSQQSETIGLDGLPFYLCAGSPKKAGQGHPTGCVRHDNRRAIVVGVCNDTTGVNATPWTYFLNGIQPLQNPFSPSAGFVAKQFFNAQPLPPGSTIIPTRSLSVRSSNNNGNPANLHHQRSGVTSSL